MVTIFKKGVSEINENIKKIKIYVKNKQNVENREMAVVIIYCNFFNNACEQESTAYYTFMPSTFFGQLLEMKLSSL